jgi:hypothetical protein
MSRRFELPEVSEATESEYGKDSELVQSTTNIEKHEGKLAGSMTSGNSNVFNSAVKGGASLLEKGHDFPHSNDILLTDENVQDGQDSGMKKGDHFPESLKSSPGKAVEYLSLEEKKEEMEGHLIENE